MGFKVHHDGFKQACKVAQCSNLHKIEANINLVVKLRERLEAP